MLLGNKIKSQWQCKINRDKPTSTLLSSSPQYLRQNNIKVRKMKSAKDTALMAFTFSMSSYQRTEFEHDCCLTVSTSWETTNRPYPSWKDTNNHCDAEHRTGR